MVSVKFFLIFVLHNFQSHSTPLTMDRGTGRKAEGSSLMLLQKIKPKLAYGLSKFDEFANEVHTKNLASTTNEQLTQDDLGKKLSTRCSACVLLVAYELSQIKNSGSSADHDEVRKWAEKGCEYFKVETPDVCKGGMRIFGDEILEVFTQIDLPPQQICGVSLPDICTQFHHLTASSQQWNVTLTHKFSDKEKPQLKQKTLPRLKVLHLSDVHIDLKYAVGSLATCDKPVCCRGAPPRQRDNFSIFNPMSGKTEGGNADWDKAEVNNRAMKWGDPRNCDLPWWTFDNLLQQLARNVTAGKLKLDYILFTGDIPAHDLWAQSKEGQLNLIHKVFSLLQKYFPKMPVFPTVGNHDSFPANNFPPEGVEVEDQFKVDWLYAALARSWSPWLPKQALETIKKGGFYTTLLKPGFRIVSLNTNFCYSENLWLWLDPRDPDGMLTWFIKVLADAERNNELVQVIGHVPPGRDPECLSVWSNNYFRIVKRFRSTIANQFFGHTHYDELAVFYDDESRLPISTAYIAPSLTTYTGMKPAFRIYEVEGFAKDSSWTVLNHQTYVMDLMKANSTNQPIWELEYDACRDYNLTELNNEVWSEMQSSWVRYLSKESEPFPKSLQQYLKFYVKRSLVSDGNEICNSTACLRNIVCDIAKNIAIPVCNPTGNATENRKLRYNKSEQTRISNVNLLKNL